MNYSEETLRRFHRPEWVGELQGEHVLVGQAENPACGDFVRVWLEMEAGGGGDAVVRRARFKAFGCAAAIAGGDAAAQLAEGRAGQELAAALDLGVEKMLGDLPPGKRVCAGLGAAALRAALA